MSWTFSLLRSQPRKGLPVALAVGATFLCALLLFHNALVALLTALVLLASVAEGLLPLHYLLDAEGAHVRVGPVLWLEMPWQNVRSVYRTPAGIKISPFSDPKTARMEPFRGVLLRFAPAEAQAVLDAVTVLCADATLSAEASGSAV